MSKINCSKEELAEARKIDLLTYLKNYEPNELVRISKDTYTTKTHDSVRINNGLWYRFAKGYGGRSAIDYLVKVYGYSLPEAVKKVLNKIDYKAPVMVEQKKKIVKEIEIPKKATDNLKVIDYLINRGIDESIINYCIINNLIYQEKTTDNVVFLGYDDTGNIKYCGLRATNESRIMRDSKGSSKEYSFRLLSDTNTSSIDLFESSIDLLSYATLIHNRGFDWKSRNLIALSGVYQTRVNIEESKLPIAVEKFLNDHPSINEIVLHFDNDVPGKNAARAIQYLLKDKYKIRNMPAPYGKDINDYLCYKLGLKSLEEDIKNSTYSNVKDVPMLAR